MTKRFSRRDPLHTRLSATVGVLVAAGVLAATTFSLCQIGAAETRPTDPKRSSKIENVPRTQSDSYTIPTIELADQKRQQVIVARNDKLHESWPDVAIAANGDFVVAYQESDSHGGGPVSAIVTIPRGFFRLTADNEAGPGRVYEVRVPSTEGANAFYASNRPPLLPSSLIKLPAGTIKPKGWLRWQLRLMADGMVGRISEVSGRVRYHRSGWVNPTGGGNEWVPYWLRGYISMGYAMEDDEIIQEAKKWVEGVMANQEEDGYFGPKGLKGNLAFPQMVMLFALRTYYEASADERVLSCMERYFRYQINLPKQELLRGYAWQRTRGGTNIETVLWLYNQQGHEWLLDLAKRLRERSADWSQGLAGDPDHFPKGHQFKENMPPSYAIPTDHGVSIAMGYSYPATYWQLSRHRADHDGTERIYALLMGDFGQMPGGMFAADERLRPGKTDPRQGAETCSVVEFMYSNESLLKITGDPKYADRCEDIAFNTYPATMTSDMKALHYLTAANMPQCDAGNKPCFRNNEKMLSFSPGAEYHCCQHNHGQGWPYYVEHLWMATHGDGLAAVMYAPCSIEATVGDGVKVKLTEETDYPFGETVDFAISTPHAVRFPLLLRIPRWCRNARVSVNGEPREISPSPSSYVVLERTWHHEDRVQLELPMEIAVTVWEKNKNSVSVNRGPLTYSLKIGEKWVASGGSDKWPEWEVLPTTPWNYALLIDHDSPADSFTFVQKNTVPKQPFVADNAPVELQAQGRRIPSWGMVDNCVGELPACPARTDEPLEKITLIPMGCARLRISAFPTLEVDADGEPTTDRGTFLDPSDLPPVKPENSDREKKGVRSQIGRLGRLAWAPVRTNV